MFYSQMQYLVFVTSVFIVMAVVAGAMIASRTEATTSFDGMVLDTFQQYSNSSEAGVAVIAGSDVTVNGTQFVDHLQTSVSIFVKFVLRHFSCHGQSKNSISEASTPHCVLCFSLRNWLRK